MRRSSSEILNNLESRIARLEVGLIQKKVGIKGFVEYLNHKLRSPKISPQDESEIKNMIDSFSHSLRTYSQHTGRIAKLLGDIDAEINGLNSSLDHSEIVMRRLKKQNDLNNETQSVSLSPSLEGEIVLKEINAKVRSTLTEISDLKSTLTEKVEKLRN